MNTLVKPTRNDPQQPGNLGGIPSTADAGLDEAIEGSSDTPPVAPAGKPQPKVGQAAPTRSGTPAGKPDADEDNALESLGKAVSAPVLGAADEDPDDPSQPHPR